MPVIMREDFSGKNKSDDPGIKARYGDFNIYGCIKFIFHARRENFMGIWIFKNIGYWHTNGCFHGIAHIIINHGDVFDDVYDKSHRADGRSGKFIEFFKKNSRAGT